MNLFLPRITIAALRGGSGKTIVSLGLISLWKDMGLSVTPFKKGPDFIDAGWLSFAASTPCYNLDPFLMTEDQIISSFLKYTKNTDFALIEGNRGLFDGVNIEGTCSTAELAKTLASPVLLVVDATMVTRTTAALVKGCQSFDPDLSIAGIVINRVATGRQEKLIRQTIEHYCDIPVVGAIPRKKENPFPERHMGLVPHHERALAKKAIDWTRNLVRNQLDAEKILEIMKGAGPISPQATLPEDSEGLKILNGRRPKVGVIKDSVFWFYYPENLAGLHDFGAELIEINSIQSPSLPDIDALYVGGGFPETQAEALAENLGFREDLRKAIERGLPVYAECGGFMFLGKELLIGGKTFPMAGALPVSFALERKPQGHGYTILETVNQNPYYRPGEILKGHEFHYSRPILARDAALEPVFRVLRGNGIDGMNDGLQKKNLLATYTHIHAGGNPDWAKRILKVAKAFNAQKKFWESEKRN
ncbi:MAG: hydrogenobyrinic acid a,c-diamide synthase (glutamine-hydrolyzing) [Deltaproteobacteria bacterium]|nr:hydrogenobyrinic acid a,c-diamide synthase (glutamine-hydrolyzing) [Deltaproteobacteria bacterium]HDM10741.1 hydrogenobyrinic acid a,c-diamide synthase (glutamine-hydrolyzing) [Desulfobacteraceae bacterium]